MAKDPVRTIEKILGDADALVRRRLKAATTATRELAHRVQEVVHPSGSCSVDCENQEAIMAASRTPWLVCASTLLWVIVALSAPAFADEADLKKQVEQGNSEFMKSFNSMDVAGLAARYATGAIIVDGEGARTDIAQYFEDSFKTGLHRAETTVDQVWPLGPDTALGMGKYRVAGQTRVGTPIDEAGLWTATYVREGGKWKIQMQSVILQRR
jgi:ketosteroid isomerase-like protein